MNFFLWKIFKLSIKMHHVSTVNKLQFWKVETTLMKNIVNIRLKELRLWYKYNEE